jgi:GT2 family glycosyltransferase
MESPQSSSCAPDVSLVVIAYNERAHIGECLESIFAQRGLDSYEVIVVDDGSVDGTADVVDSLLADHPQLRLIKHTTNLGRGAARRTGQDASSAGTIGFIDSDIRLPSDWLVHVTTALKDADAVSGVAVPDGDCAVIWRIFRPKPKGMLGYWELTGNNVIFRRSALELVGWPAQSRLTEDNRLAVAMVQAGLRVRTLESLRVEHHEAKSYRRTLAYLHETGFNATEILRDLHRFRFPDLVWVCWVASLVGLGVAAGTGAIPWWVAAAVFVGITMAIDVGAMMQRFYFQKSPIRWLAATLANLPLITMYLAARTFYAPRLLMRRRSALS